VPTYQYACTECGHALEAQQSFTDEPLSTCPDCSGRLRKVFSAVGVVFKGSGFYRNDSRPDSAASSGSSEESSGSSDSKTETKKADKNSADSSAASSSPSTSTPSSSGSAA
jgi:putative FmdB family regulatory protein